MRLVRFLIYALAALIGLYVLAAVLYATPMIGRVIDRKRGEYLVHDRCRAKCGRYLCGRLALTASHMAVSLVDLAPRVRLGAAVQGNINSKGECSRFSAVAR
jgi:hypothetical protein